MTITATSHAPTEKSDKQATQTITVNAVISGYADYPEITAVLDRLGPEVCGAPPRHEPDRRRSTLTGPQEAVVEVHWQAAPPRRGTLDIVEPAPPHAQLVVLTRTHGSAGADWAAELTQRLIPALRASTDCYTPAEIEAITAAMPLLARFATPEAALRGWALLFRDHYVENSIGFLLGLEKAGLDPDWVFALSKGDKTEHRDRVHAWYRARGYRSDLLDNSVINGSANQDEQAYARKVTAEVDEFIRRAHADGRKVLVIDDGGLLAQGRGSAGAPTEAVDAAIELTVSGLKRIKAAGELTVPVFNLARSRLKSQLGYNEIADSCVRRLRAILPGEKFIGRTVLSLGCGVLGARTAYYLRSLGCQVSVVDTDVLAAIQAAEHGFTTYRSLGEALRHISPFLIMGNTGELALTEQELPLLPDGVYLAGFATKDFSLLGEREGQHIPGVGVRHELPGGKHAVLLGDGRSLNLFEFEGIANRGYDAYRAGTLIAAKKLCREIDSLAPGLHLAPVDAEIERAGLFEAYYEQYLTHS